MAARQGLVALLAMTMVSAMGTPARASDDRSHIAPLASKGLSDPEEERSRESELAIRTGEPVEVLSRRGETRELFALPDGTFEAREYVAPVWTRRDGEWVGVDLTLTTGEKGLVPTASTVDLTFSAWGDHDLVALVRGGGKLALTWPEPLPAPVLEGLRATYPDVLPDVDLRMEAVDDGFLSLFVVHTPEAAANPALDELRQGLDVQVSEDGGLEAVDTGTGGTVFRAPTPLMWDSSLAGEDNADGPPTAFSRSVDPTPGSDSAADPLGEPAPGDSANLTTLDILVDEGDEELVLLPDAEVLRGGGDEVSGVHRSAVAFPPGIGVDDGVAVLGGDAAVDVQRALR
ncbi:hypothetical protein [Streptomyces alkaliphilus]|uniref:hypothetical protein n=1 Tax=Streptomyces alkaliphilus TaxID=1472722 RepID=UPI0015FD905D|nr:hypothetical protein [Streptomyces alkaliphilus]